MLRFIVGLLAISIASFPETGIAEQSRGIGVVPVVTQNGKKIALYKGSHALLIGMSDYTAGWPDLESVPSELQELEGTLAEHGFNVTKIMNPDSRELTEGFEKFINQYGYDRDNRLLVFYSGHGYSRSPGGRQRGYLVPVDAPNPQKDEIGFLRKALDMGQIQTWARRIEAKHALFLFDSCFSGTIFKTRALPVPRHISDKTTKPIRQFITAGSAGEEVPAKSIFLPLFIRAINGEGDINKDGYITGTELGQFLHERVLSYNAGQTPQYGKIKDPSLDEGDFVFINPETAKAGIAAGSSRASLGSPNVSGSVQSLDTEEEFWKAIRNSKTASDFQTYLREFPGGRFETLAKLMIRNIERAGESSGGQEQSTSVAFFPALITGERANDYKYRTGEFQRIILQALRNNLKQARVRFTYDDKGFEDLEPKPKSLGSIRKLGEDSWEGFFSKTPNEEYIKQVANKIGINLAVMYKISADAAGKGSYAFYMIDVENSTLYEKSGYWHYTDLKLKMAQDYKKIFEDYKSFEQ